MQPSGAKGWHQVFSKEFAQRWPSLLEAMLQQKTVQLAFLSPAHMNEAGEGWKASTLPNCFTYDRKGSGTDESIEPGLVEHVYYLDAASAIAAYSLDVQRHHKVLDLCSAPGGKALILATQLFGDGLPEGHLTCNEWSMSRRKRLEKTLRDRFSKELFQSRRIQFTSANAMDCKTLERNAPFDRILLDAVCSSDYHLLKKSDAALARWTIGALKANSQKQLLMIKAATRLLRATGTLLYCTCALSDVENDKVIEKALKELKASISVIPVLDDSALKQYDIAVIPFTLETSNKNKASSSMGNCWLVEETKYGIRLLPDKSKCGPIYMCKLRRT